MCVNGDSQEPTPALPLGAMIEYLLIQLFELIQFIVPNKGQYGE